MGVGPVCQTSLSTGLSEWERGPCHAEWSPIPINERKNMLYAGLFSPFYAEYNFFYGGEWEGVDHREKIVQEMPLNLRGSSSAIRGINAHTGH